MKRFFKKKKYWFLFLAALFAALIVLYHDISKYDGKLHITFFDIGQGDSALLQYQDFSLLVDGGPGNYLSSRIGKRLPFFDRELDLVVATHPQEDHFFGLVKVTESIKVERVLVSQKESENQKYNEWIEWLERKKIPVLFAYDVDKIQVDNMFSVKVLYPKEESDVVNTKNANNSCVVLLVSFGDTDILFTCDIEEPTEKLLLEKYGKKLDVEILKTAHHGSDTSSNKDFLQILTPETAIISVGKNNRYGHPSRRVLNRLEQMGVKIFRTDVDGDVELVSDGKKYEVK